MAMRVADSLFNQLTFLLRVLQRPAFCCKMCLPQYHHSPENVQEVGVPMLCSFKFM